MDFVKDESFSEEMLFWRVLILLFVFTIAARISSISNCFSRCWNSSSVCPILLSVFTV